MRAPRLWIALGVIVAISAAHARVIMTPTIQRNCPGGASWDKTAACIGRYGKLKVLHTDSTTRLVEVTNKEAFFDAAGIYLYILREGNWRIGGMQRGPGYAFVSLSRPTFDGRSIYRIDVTRWDGDDGVVTPRRAAMRQRVALFCTGASVHCVWVLTACDFFIAGKTYNSFRGTPTYKAGELHVSGDRTLSGDLCHQADRVPLSLPTHGS